MFARDAVVRRVDAEAVLLLGGGRALLMQLAHPGVARGVADHSDFRTDPWSRLVRTLNASYTIVFGTREQAEETAAAIRSAHGRVRGPGYRANDPELLLWVHSTLVDTAWRIHRRFLGDLDPADAERYYQESTRVAELLGVPRRRQPEDLQAFREYMRHMVSTLEVTPVAREVAQAVLHPSLPGPLAALAAPAAGLARQLTVGLLPPPLRRGYGFGWDAARQAMLDATGLALRQVLPRVPPVLRHLPAAG